MDHADVRLAPVAVVPRCAVAARGAPLVERVVVEPVGPWVPLRGRPSSSSSSSSTSARSSSQEGMCLGLSPVILASISSLCSSVSSTSFHSFSLATSRMRELFLFFLCNSNLATTSSIVVAGASPWWASIRAE